MQQGGGMQTTATDKFGNVKFLLSHGMDQDTRKHSHRVRRYALAFGKKVGLTIQEIKQLLAAALLHDIGKACIDQRLLCKPTALTPDERKTIQMHPVIGNHILTGMPFPQEIRMLVEQHHEAFDGTGYPYGSKGEDILPGARILAIIDSYDAMTTVRPYRQTMCSLQAMREIHCCSGSQFDPALVKYFTKALFRAQWDH